MPVPNPPRFAANDILSLTEEHVRFDLAESVGPDLLLGELLAEVPADLALGYGTAPGNRVLRDAIAARCGVGADEVVVTAGGVHALFLVALATCEAGDSVLAVTPNFPAAIVGLDALRLDVVRVPAHFDTRYRLNLDAVRARITPATRLVSVASPQNPSGVALRKADVIAMLDAMESVCPDAVLMVDETYREAVYGDAQPADSLASLDARVVTLASLSKCHGAPGLRVGWLTARNPKLREQLLLGKFNTVISLSRVDEWLALRVLERADALLERRRLHLADTLAETERFVKNRSAQLEWVRPDSGALCCVRLRRDVFDEADVEAFHAAAKVRDVRVARGTWFGDEPHVFRLGFGLLDVATYRTGLERLGDALDSVHAARAA